MTCLPRHRFLRARKKIKPRNYHKRGGGWEERERERERGRGEHRQNLAVGLLLRGGQAGDLRLVALRALVDLGQHLAPDVGRERSDLLQVRRCARAHIHTHASCISDAPKDRAL